MDLSLLLSQRAQQLEKEVRLMAASMPIGGLSRSKPSFISAWGPGGRVQRRDHAAPYQKPSRTSLERTISQGSDRTHATASCPGSTKLEPAISLPMEDRSADRFAPVGQESSTAASGGSAGQEQQPHDSPAWFSSPMLTKAVDLLATPDLIGISDMAARKPPPMTLEQVKQLQAAYSKFKAPLPDVSPTPLTASLSGGYPGRLSAETSCWWGRAGRVSDDLLNAFEGVASHPYDGQRELTKPSTALTPEAPSKAASAWGGPWATLEDGLTTLPSAFGGAPGGYSMMAGPTAPPQEKKANLTRTGSMLQVSEELLRMSRSGRDAQPRLHI